jgi:hypothetical protein
MINEQRYEVGKELGKHWTLVSPIEVSLFSCCANTYTGATLLPASMAMRTEFAVID